MTHSANAFNTCPTCGHPVASTATVCPHCNHALRPDDACEYCGARMVDDKCPVCGAVREGVNPVAAARRWTALAVVLAVGALIGSAWLTRPWSELPYAPPETNLEVRYSDIPTPTATRTNTATATSTATATMTPTATATPTPEYIIYTVQRGDVASTIAQQFGITTAEVLAANGLTEYDILHLGQELRIPTTGLPTPEPTEEPATEQPAETPTPPPAEPTQAPTATPTPTTTEPPTTEATVTPVIHVVAAGEHLGVIAQRYGLTQQEIAQANGITVDSILQIGQELIIPVPGGSTPAPAAQPVTHIVQAGEVLGAIAMRYGVTSAEIAAANGISVNSYLQIGQELIIPVTQPAPTTPAPTPTEQPAPTSAPTPMAQATAAPTAAAPAPTPGPVVHVVQAGEVLGAIAMRYGVSSAEIAEANGISVNSYLQIGQELIIPGTQAEPTPEPPPEPTAEAAAPATTPLPVGGLLAEPATPTPLPTGAPGPRRLILPRPVLLSPATDTVFNGPDAHLLLSWASSAILQDDEWYQLALWTSNLSDPDIEVWTKATSWRVPKGLYPREGASRVFWWRVTVVRRVGEGPVVGPLSPDSQVYKFYWQ